MLTIEPTIDIPLVHELFVEYAKSLNVSLCFQNFDQELATLPGDYDPILLAKWDGRVAGCVAMHPYGDDACEMKRLYVRPEFRAYGIGRALTHRVIDEAKQRGYRRLLLDTLPSMQAAIGLYRSLGFSEIDPYRVNPVEGARYMQLQL